MLHDLLADPETRRLITAALIPVFPIQGGNPGTPNRIPKYDGSGTGFVDTETPIHEDAINKRIGIGTGNPDHKLEVRDSSSVFIRSRSTGADSTAGLSLNNDVRDWVLRVNGGDGDKFQIRDVNADAQRLTIDTAGNVGIGTPSPTEKLDVVGNIKSDGLNKIVFLRPNGSTDGTQINNAINALPSNGGIIYLMPGEYHINTMINVNKHGVKLRGYGGGNLFYLNLTNAALTVLKWVGSAGGTVVQMRSPNQNAEPLGGLELSDLEIQGAGIGSGTGLLLSFVSNSRFTNLRIKNSGVGIKLTTESNQPDYNSLFNLFENITIYDVYRGLILDGTITQPAGTIADTSQNVFVNVQVLYWGNSASNAGIWLKLADANVFIRTQIARWEGAGGGTQGHGVVIENPQEAQANYFYHLAPDGGVIVKNANLGPHPEGKNVIFGHTIGGSTSPTTDPSSVPPQDVVAWTTATGDMEGFKASIASFKQAARPSLSRGQVAFWHRDPGDQFKGLLFYDGTSYYWWAAPSDGITAVKCFGNPT